MMDRSLSLFQHSVHERPATAEDAVEVDVDHAQPVGIGHRFDWNARLCDARVADQDVSVTPALGEILGRGFDRIAVGDVKDTSLNVETMLLSVA